MKKTDADCPKKASMKDSSKGIHKELVEADEYVRLDVFNEYRKGMDERCTTHEERLKSQEARQKGIDQKITATLVFVIATLVAILSAICTGLLH